MNSFKSIIAIPGRLDSSRLPKKLLEDINGMKMIERVLFQCKKARGPIKVVLCTDSNELQRIATNNGFKVLMTSSNCSSGTERIAEVSKKLIEIAWNEDSNETLKEDQIEKKSKQTLIINVQGDQPFIDPLIIEKMHNFYSSMKESIKVVTPIYKLKKEKIHRPEIVKVLLGLNNKAIYFSRSAVPHVRDVDPKHWANFADYWGHVGIYGVMSDILLNWSNILESPLEKVEKLEQLRFIESEIPINTFIVEDETLSIDTHKQLEHAKKIACKLGI